MLPFTAEQLGSRATKASTSAQVLNLFSADCLSLAKPPTGYFTSL